MKITKYDLTDSCCLPTQFQDGDSHDQRTFRGVGIGAQVQITTVFRFGGVSYTAQQNPKYPLSLTDSSKWQLLTSFNIEKDSITPDIMISSRDRFVESDDVFCESFLETILLVTNERCVGEETLELFKTWGCSTVFQLPKVSNITSGPYFYCSDGIFWVWRLYVDEYEAFVLSTIPSQRDSEAYEALTAVAPGASTLAIAVPSRLYFQRSLEFPLAGLRLSIKDVFHLKGVHTGAGNRAYRRLYHPQSLTSPIVQRAIDLGAIVVGKTKTAEFAGSQEVIGDWCDYSYPFNVRGDGYLVSTGSSTGSASSIAAYPWIDVSLGSDAGGSIRDPSVVHGIYGFRPTHDGSATKDAFIPCPIFQVPGFMARSSYEMLEFGKNWLRAPAGSTSLDVDQLWFPQNYYSDREDVQAIVEDMVSKLAHWFQIDNIDRQSVEDSWVTTNPVAVRTSFYTYFHKTFMDLLKAEYWEYTAAFRENYQQKFKAAPYVCKITQWLWSDGCRLSPERKCETLDEVQIHNEWLSSKLFKSGNTLLVFPMYNLSHRDEYWGPPEQRGYDGFDSNLHASLAGLPNIIVPIGQCQYYSNMKQRVEFFPVSISIVSSKGTDVSLLRLVDQFLKDNELPDFVMTGARAFSNIERGL